MAPDRLLGWAPGVVAIAITAAAAFGLSSREIELNLGPGDSAFVSGFEERSDVDNKVGWHWTTYDATVELPFMAQGGTLETSLRYARIFVEEAVVDVSVGSVQTETFRARGGEVRTTVVSAEGVRGPLAIGIKVDSHERRNLGLRLDRLRVTVPSGSPLKLRTEAALRPVLVAVLLLLGLAALGASPAAAGGLTLLAALGFAAAAQSDLFGAWRQSHAAIPMLVVGTLFLFASRWGMERLGLARRDAVWLVCAALVTMLFRLVLVSHPAFYYPDLLTHTRVVETIRELGPSFFQNPAESLNAQGAWTKPVLGSMSSLPYAVMFHTPFAALAWAADLSTDQIETALKAGSSLISVLPILLAGLLAPRFSLPPLSALALCVIPSYTSRLSFALLPALLGHTFDLIVLLALASVLRGNRIESTRDSLRLMAALLAGHLAYTSSVVNEGVLMVFMVLLALASGRSGLVSAGRLGLAEAIAALLAFGLYYRHFVADVAGLVSRLVGFRSEAGAPSVYAIESFWAVLFERTGSFFGWPWITLAVAGLVMAGSAARKSSVVQAWGLTYLGLILLRAKIPDVFRYGHETLFLTPIVGLLAGSAVILAFRAGGVSRLAAIGCGLVLSILSFWRQWLAVAEQFGNAL